MNKIFLALLFVSSIAQAQTRSLTLENRYVWTVFDTPCSSVANPDLLPLKDARIIDLQTSAQLDGCALEQDGIIEFQMYLSPNRIIQQKYFSRDFKVQDSI
jgi:hypothetical protein